MGSVRLIQLSKNEDLRGKLVSIEGQKDIPFDIKRIYYIFDTDEQQARGYHAHLNLSQLVICVRGECEFLTDNGVTKHSFHLNTPSEGLLLQGVIWREMCNFSHDCILLVLASEYYKPDDYIWDYSKFLTEAKIND